MRIFIITVSLLLLFNCRSAGMREKKAEFEDSKVEFHAGEASRAPGYSQGKRRYFPKDRSKNFFVQEVVAVNKSSEELQIPFFLFSVSDVKPDRKKLPKQKASETDEKNPLTSRASAVLSCCGFGESFISNIKSSFDAEFSVPTVKPGESVSRSVYFIYPADNAPKYIQFLYSVKDSKDLIFADPVEIKVP